MKFLLLLVFNSLFNIILYIQLLISRSLNYTLFPKPFGFNGLQAWSHSKKVVEFLVKKMDFLFRFVFNNLRHLFV